MNPMLSRQVDKMAWSHVHNYVIPFRKDEPKTLA